MEVARDIEQSTEAVAPGGPTSGNESWRKAPLHPLRNYLERNRRMQRQTGYQPDNCTEQPFSGIPPGGRVKIKSGSRYVYQCSHISTTSGGLYTPHPLHVVAMCISQGVFGLLGSRYVYTFIIYHGVFAFNNRRKYTRAHQTRQVRNRDGMRTFPKQPYGEALA